MANPISTTGLAKPVSTTKRPNETTQGWIQRHTDGVNQTTPDGDKLTTQYTSAAGPEEVVTNRLENESDQDFLDRHIGDYTAAMVGSPPIP